MLRIGSRLEALVWSAHIGGFPRQGGWGEGAGVWGLLAICGNTTTIASKSPRGVAGKDTRGLL